MTVELRLHSLLLLLVVQWLQAEDNEPVPKIGQIDAFRPTRADYTKPS